MPRRSIAVRSLEDAPPPRAKGVRSRVGRYLPRGPFRCQRRRPYGGSECGKCRGLAEKPMSSLSRQSRGPPEPGSSPPVGQAEGAGQHNQCRYRRGCQLGSPTEPAPPKQASGRDQLHSDTPKLRYHSCCARSAGDHALPCDSSRQSFHVLLRKFIPLGLTFLVLKVAVKEALVAGRE